MRCAACEEEPQQAPSPTQRGRVELREVASAEPVAPELAVVFDPVEHQPPAPYVAAALGPPPQRPDPGDTSNRVFAVVALLVMVVCVALVLSVGLLVFAFVQSTGQAPLQVSAHVQTERQDGTPAQATTHTTVHEERHVSALESLGMRSWLCTDG